MKKNYFKKILLIIFVIIIILLINNIIKNIISKNILKDVKNIKNEEELILIVDINPSIALKIKNGTVIESFCLDQDCQDLLRQMKYNYDDNLNNQKVDKVLNEFYQGAKTYGYDTTNGITVSSSSSSVEILVNDVKNVSFKSITVEEENNTLNESNIEFKESELTKEEYNNKLLEKLKNDPDYGELFTCDIYDFEVKCYMIDFMAEIMDEFGKESILSKLATLEATVFKFRNLLQKFDIKYEVDQEQITKTITLGNGTKFDYTDSYEYVINNDNNEPIDNIYIVNCLFYEKYKESDTKEVLEDKIYLLPLTKVELLTKTYDKKDIILIDRTTVIPTVQYGI